MYDPVEKLSRKVIYAVRPQRRANKCLFGRLGESKGATPLRQIFLMLMILTVPITNISEAQPPPRYEFSIPAQPADNALNQLAVQVEASLIFPYDQVLSVESNPVFGFYTVEECLAVLLRGTGLSSDHTEDQDAARITA
ncbi:MAG: STN domain-containing protein [Pseudomonadales bacterium]